MFRGYPEVLSCLFLEKQSAGKLDFRPKFRVRYEKQDGKNRWFDDIVSTEVEEEWLKIVSKRIGSYSVNHFFRSWQRPLKSVILKNTLFRTAGNIKPGWLITNTSSSDLMMNIISKEITHEKLKDAFDLCQNQS